MKKNLFLITEEEKRRILGLHQSATKRGYLSEQEQTVQYYKDQTGKVIKLVGNYSIPLESTPATPEEYDAQNKPVEGGGGQGAKVITNNDKSYDYKEENGKYYYSKKGQNQWVEAKGDINNPKSPLGAIKNLKWDTATPMPSPTNPTSGSTVSTGSTLSTGNTEGTTGSTLSTGNTEGTMTTLKPSQIKTTPPQLQGVVDTTNMASRRDIRQGYRQGKRDVRKLEREVKEYQNTIKRMANKMTPEQRAQYDAKIAQLQIQINQSAT
jgi:hypothetical protein